MASHPRGEYPLNPGGQLFSSAEWRRLREHLDLSTMQLRILQRLVAGRQRAAIALDLDRSIHTINSHVRRMFRKLEVRSTAELIARAFDEFRRARLADESTREENGDAA